MAYYEGKIQSHALGESKEAHTPSVRLKVDAVLDQDTGNPVSKQFWVDLWLTDKAIQRTAETLRSLGFQGSSFAELNYGQDLVGAPVELVTEWEQYNGQDVERVKYVNAPGSYASRGIKACDDATAKRIASRYDAILRNTRAASAAPAPRAASAAPAPRAAQPRPVRQQEPPLPPPPTANDDIRPDNDLPF